MAAALLKRPALLSREPGWAVLRKPKLPAGGPSHFFPALAAQMAPSPLQLRQEPRGWVGDPE